MTVTGAGFAFVPPSEAIQPPTACPIRQGHVK